MRHRHRGRLAAEAVQFVADPLQALREARRVLASGGPLLVSVATSIADAPVYAALAEALETHVGAEPAALLRGMFALSGLDDALTAAGFDEVAVQPYRAVLRWPSAQAFVRYLESAPFGSAVQARGPDTAAKIADHVIRRVTDSPEGDLPFPVVTNIATGTALT